MSDREALETVVVALWNEGSPVAQPERKAQIADVALRRWNSYSRRHRKRQAAHEQRVEDLAKGLRDRLAADASLVGSLMEDYRYLAARLAGQLAKRPLSDE